MGEKSTQSTTEVEKNKIARNVMQHVMLRKKCGDFMSVLRQTTMQVSVRVNHLCNYFFICWCFLELIVLSVF